MKNTNLDIKNKTPYFKWHKKTGFTIAGYINEESKDGK